MSEKIFIAYSHNDSKYVHRLFGALEDRGLSVWVDEKINIGADWVQTIEDHLRSCSALILIMSSFSYKSKWVQNELNMALRYNKPIFPILIEGQDPWLNVQNLQYVDARDGELPSESFFERLSYVVLGKSIETEQAEDKVILPPKPYKGRKNFIFSSYKREEMEIIAAYLNSIVDWGYSVWYDAGIPGGADWLDMIESKVTNCKLMVVFLSPAAVNSKWVRNEVFLAMTKGKPIVAVKLEEVELKHGLGLALVSTQILECWSNDIEENLKTAIRYHM